MRTLKFIFIGVVTYLLLSNLISAITFNYRITEQDLIQTIEYIKSLGYSTFILDYYIEISLILVIISVLWLITFFLKQYHSLTKINVLCSVLLLLSYLWLYITKEIIGITESLTGLGILSHNLITTIVIVIFFISSIWFKLKSSLPIPK